jgi:hypothetical protein
MEKANLCTELNSNLTSLLSLFLMTGNLERMVVISSIGWKNLIKADSDASPIVGISSHGMLFNFYYQSARNAASFSYFSSEVRCLSVRMRSC